MMPPYDQRLAALIALSFAASCGDGIPPISGEARVIWRVPSNAASNSAPHDPATNNDLSMVYFATPDNRFKKLRAADGGVVWNVQAGPAATTFPQWNAVLAAGVAAIAKVDVIAFDTTKGALRWTYVPADGELTGYSPLVADETSIYAAGSAGRVHAIDALTGRARWVTDLRGGASDVGAFNPSYADGTVYVCTKNFSVPPIRGTLWALNTTTGAVRWSYPFQPELPQQGSSCFGSAAIWQNLVIQPQEDGRVFAFDRTNGSVAWTAPRVHDVGRSWGDRRWAAASATTLVVTSSALEGMIVAYDPATGAERWRHQGNGGSLYPPVVGETTVYVDHGWIFAAYNVETGRVNWQNPRSVAHPETVYKGRPIIASDRIFVAGTDGSYALRK